MKATKKQRRLLEEYVRWMADAMELRDWTFTIAHEPPDDQKFSAVVDCLYGRKRATISFCKDFLTTHRPEQIRATVCHELIHCHFKSIEWAYNNLQGSMDPTLFHVIWCGIHDQLEFGIDAMADAVAKHLPLPKWAEGKSE